jgi:predicted DNA-binding transcriptional regulator AlpA
MVEQDEARCNIEDDSGNGDGHGVIQELAELHEDALIDAAALARHLGVCDRTLRRMIRRGELPPPVRMGGRSRWLAGRVRQWINDRAALAEKDAARELARLRAL